MRLLLNASLLDTSPWSNNRFHIVPLYGTVLEMVQKLQHKSLDRGITVMEILAREGASSLAELHRASGISKSSIRRLLATLIDRRLVRQSLADKKFRITVVFPVATSEPVPADQAYILDVALPIVTEMTKSIEWPSDVHLLDGDRMRVLDSTRPLSPFHLYRGVVNRQLNIFGSATGMCCLAELGDREFNRIAAHSESDPIWGLRRFNITRDDYLHHLHTTRNRGYGTRIASFVGVTDFDDGLAAIARPIYARDKLVGAISVLWPKNYISNEEFAAKYFADLKKSTDQISAALQ